MLANSDVEADVALSRCAPSGPRSLTPVVMQIPSASRARLHATLAIVGQAIDYRGRARGHARIDDALRVVAAALLFALLATIRRLFGRRRRRPTWSFGLEVTVAAYRGSWSVMPRIGLVRWRNVGEALSPLKMDGLEPRFIQYTSGPNEICAAWLDPPDAVGAIMLYFHGGGFVFGSLRTHGNHIGALARASRARTLAIEYRLAPEDSVPAALNDAVAAYHLLLAEGITSNRIVLAGDSAGGTLVLNVLIALRDSGAPMPAAGVAISPWVDLECSGESFRSNAELDFVGETHCRLAAASYLAGTDPRRPDISPLFADLSGLPPLLVQAGDAEVLIDQVRELVRRAEALGVAVRASFYPDMVHVWHMLRGVAPEAQLAIDEVGRFVREHTSNRGAGSNALDPSAEARIRTRAEGTA
jgi:epsilon-lactone hydrolase